MEVTFVAVCFALAIGVGAGLWLGRRAALAEIKAEVIAGLRNDDQRAASIAFLQTFTPDDLKPSKRAVRR